MNLKQISAIVFAGALIGAGSLSSFAFAQEYGMFPKACVAPPEGHVEVGNGKLSITETEYVRSGAKKDLGNGWFEANYDVEAEGEIQDSVVLRLKITPEKIWIVKVKSGEEFSADACSKPKKNANGVSIMLDADGGKCDGSARFILKKNKLTVKAELRYFLSYDEDLPVIRVEKDSKYPDRIVHIIANHPIAGEVNYIVADERSVLGSVERSQIFDPSDLHEEGLINVLQDLQPCK